MSEKQSRPSRPSRNRVTGIRAGLRRTLLAIAGLGGLAAAGLAVAVLCFPYDASQLDPARGGPLELVDRDGRLLRRVPAQGHQPGRRAWVPLSQIPSAAYAVVVASEDRRFYRHPGVDLAGLLRAAALDLQRGRLVYGGSTITMQLMRMMHSAGKPRTIINKLRETVLALRVERALSKREILEQYLNRSYYGNGAYGLEAAARTYFGKPARSLSAGEATLLALVPRAPTAYNPLHHLERLKRRRTHVLALAERCGLLDREQIGRIVAEPLAPELHRPPIRAGHFTDWVLTQLPSATRRLGGRVETTLDLTLQEQLEHTVAQHVAALAPHRLDQAGLVVLDTQSGAIRAMVGSTDYTRVKLNITTWRRHPGSALKPFVYALALEAGDNPATVAYDVHDIPSAYDVIRPTQPERGPVSYREALAGSYNLAAIHVLERVGVQRLIGRLEAAHLGPLPQAPDQYGLRLALGSAKTRLLALASAYGFLTRGGRVQRARGIRQVRGPRGERWRPASQNERQVFSPRVAYLVMHMLSDPEARRPMFGQELPLDLPFPVAAKTGTARGFADTVAVGTTHEITAAAWAGNFDGRPTHGLLAMRAAAPLVRAALLAAANHRSSPTRAGRLTLPSRPEGIVGAEVCALSGQRPGPHCPHRRHELFIEARQPKRPCSWHQQRDGEAVVVYPDVLAPWARRQRTRGGQRIASAARP
jgi:penicillin-binding protein 1C